MAFTCNITGNIFDLNDQEKNRELASRFGYNSRFRAICYVFTVLFYGECKVLSDLPINKSLKGIGMSDSGWATIFEEKFNYTNTFYHKSPFLNIYNREHVSNFSDLDFIISSDVFEHIEPYPSIQQAFNNLNLMLKCNGRLIFSVPYSFGEHKEHFPNLYDYKIVNEDGKYTLHNRTKDNKTEIHEDLCFHGGTGLVLEMRIFSKKSIEYYLAKAGFVDIVFNSITSDMMKYGIFWSKNGNNDSGLIISARKP